MGFLFFSRTRTLRFFSVREAVCVGMGAVLATVLGRLAWGVPLSCAIIPFAPLAVAGVIDAAIRILPDPLLALSAALALAVRLGSFFEGRSERAGPWITVGIASAVGAGLFWWMCGEVMARTGRLGRGDAKLMGVLGLWLGFPGVVSALAIGISLAAVYSAVRVFLGKMTMLSSFAYGPWLVAGGWTVCVGLGGA